MSRFPIGGKVRGAWVHAIRQFLMRRADPSCLGARLLPFFGLELMFLEFVEPNGSFIGNLIIFLFLIDHLGKALRPSGVSRSVAKLGRGVIESVYPRQDEGPDAPAEDSGPSSMQKDVCTSTNSRDGRCSPATSPAWSPSPASRSRDQDGPPGWRLRGGGRSPVQNPPWRHETADGRLAPVGMLR